MVQVVNACHCGFLVKKDPYDGRIVVTAVSFETERAGLLPNDVLISVDEIGVLNSSIQSVQSLLSAGDIGSNAKIEYLRQDSKRGVVHLVRTTRPFVATTAQYQGNGGDIGMIVPSPRNLKRWNSFDGVSGAASIIQFQQYQQQKQQQHHQNQLPCTPARRPSVGNNVFFPRPVVVRRNSFTCGSSSSLLMEPNRTIDLSQLKDIRKQNSMEQLALGELNKLQEFNSNSNLTLELQTPNLNSTASSVESKTPQKERLQMQ